MVGIGPGTYQRYTGAGKSLGGFDVLAMAATGMSYLSLETPLRVGGMFTGVCDIKVFDTFQASHRLVTRIAGQVVEFRGVLRPGFTSFFICEAHCHFQGDRWIVITGPTTRVYPRQCGSTGGLNMIIETCSGLGAMGVGFAFAGIKTLALNDMNEVMCEMAARHRPQTPIIRGDIGDLNTVCALAELTDCPVPMGAGVACQPYSQLGDGAAELDSRAQSLPSTLRAAYLLSAPILILECVEQAMTQPWFQSMLQQFTQQTGYSLAQTVLHLDQIWVAKRSRWWCILVHPSLGQLEIPPLPRLEKQPVVGDLLQDFWPCTPEELSALECDLYEVRTFKDYGGLEASTLSMDKVCRTCLHSCGSQLSGCPCGCRKIGFTMQRISEKGLHGLLVPLKGVLVHASGDTYPKMRHVHPWELSLLNGLPPEWPWAKDLKQALVGIGQLASPIQAAWVASQYIHLLRRQDLLRVQAPRPVEALGNLFMVLFQCRDNLNVVGKKEARLASFERRVFQSLGLVPIEKSDVEGFTPKGSEQEGPTPPAPKEDHPQQMTDIHSKEHHSEAAEQSQGDHTTDTTAERVALRQAEALAFTSKGAVPGFGTMHNDRDNMQTEHGLANSSPASLPATMPYTNEDDSPSQAIESIQIWIQPPGQNDVFPVAIPKGTTVGMVLQAEAKLSGEQEILTPVSLLGEAWPLSMEVEKSQVILTRDGTQWNPRKGTFDGGSVPRFPEGANRQEILFQQGGWIAMDEMIHYMQALLVRKEFRAMKPFEFHPDHEWQHQLTAGMGMWQEHVRSEVDHSGTVFVVLVEHHWTPVVVESIDQMVNITTTPDSPALVQALAQWAGCHPSAIQTSALPSAFRADCGWQSLAWLISQTDGHGGEAVSHDRACQLRTAYWLGLRYGGRHLNPVVVPPMGGMANQRELHNKLMALLQDHGVPQDHSSERADQILRQLGSGPITQAFQSNRPWQEIKQLANQAQPRFQIVLPSELERQLAARAASQTPVARNRHKRVDGQQERKPVANIQADDIVIPAGVFRQTDGTLLSQITLPEVSNKCKGLVVQTPADGATLLKASRPVTGRARPHPCPTSRRHQQQLDPFPSPF